VGVVAGGGVVISVTAGVGETTFERNLALSEPAKVNSFGSVKTPRPHNTTPNTTPISRLSILYILCNMFIYIESITRQKKAIKKEPKLLLIVW
jgi:hypothetical protein